MHDWLVKYLAKSKTVVVPMPFTTYTYIADPACSACLKDQLCQLSQGETSHASRQVKFSLNSFTVSSRALNFLKGEVYHSYMEVLLGNGVFNVDGELWRRQRKMASFEFASKNLRDFSTVVFREYSLKLSAILREASFHNQEVDMQVANR